MAVTVWGLGTDDRLEQWSNAESPIHVTEPGIVIEVKLAFSAHIPCGIDIKPSGSLILENSLSLRAPHCISFT